MQSRDLIPPRNERLDFDRHDHNSRDLDMYTPRKEAMNENETSSSHVAFLDALPPVHTRGRGKRKEKKDELQREAFGLLVISRQADCTCSSRITQL